MPISFKDIEDAQRVLDAQVVRTPAVPAPALSQASGAAVTLKLENLQVTGAFKARGALVRLLDLDEAQRKAGIVAASAGNHAQGVAYHARRLEIPATIVMPEETPFTKVARTEALGATVVLEGETFADAYEAAHRLVAEKGLTFIHPYDDPRIIAGQGTVGLELLHDAPDLDALIVPVGGGGLISGVATAARHLKPDIRIYGAQAALYPSMAQVLRGQAPEVGGQTVAEGIAVKAPGRLTAPVVRALVDEVLLVDEAAIENAIQMFLEDQKIVAEGAAAAPLAALLAHRERFAGHKVGLVVSGGNIDARLLSSILLRGLVRAGRLVRLRIELRDSPGSLSKVARVIGDADANIVEIVHQRLFHDVPVKMAEVEVVVETQDSAHVDALIARLREAGFPTRHLGSRMFDADP